MATRKAVIRAAVDSIKPLHLRKVCALGGSPAWERGGRGGGRGGGTSSLVAGPPVRTAARGSARVGGIGRDSLVGPSRASLVQGGRPPPAAAPRPAPSLVQGRPQQAAPSLVSGRPGAAATPKLNGVPVQAQQQPQHHQHHQQQQQGRANLVRGRRSTLNGVVKLANGERVNGARPAYLLRQQQQPRYNASTSGQTAVVTDLTTDQQGDGTKSSDTDGTTNPSSYESDLVVVLDMDECLIHSQFLSQQSRSFSAPDIDSNDDETDGGTKEMEDRYRQPDIRPTKSSAFHTDEEAESIIASNCEYFRIHLPDGDLVHVNKRPNLDAFLKEVTARFETHIFTAAVEVYADPLLDRLESDLGTNFAGRFYREHCVLDPDLGVYVKDLGLILDKGRESGSDWGSAYDSDDEEEKKEECDANSSTDLSSFDEGRVVLVDNNPLSFLANPSNGILVSNFYDDPKDATLEAVMELLHELDPAEDVRPVLESKFGLKDALRDVVRSSDSWR